MDPADDCAKINIRLHNYNESMIALKNLKAAYIGTSEIFFCLAFTDVCICIL